MKSIVATTISVLSCIYIAHEIQLALACPSGIPGVDPTTYLKGLLGGIFTTSNLPDGRTGNVIDELTNLDCQFESICRWGSEGPHESPWFLGSGKPDPNLWETLTGTNVMPQGKFAIHAKVPGKKSDSLMSDPINCLKDDAGSLSFRYWTYGDASFKVCALKASDKKTEIFCSREISKAKPLIPGSPEETFVEIPNDINEPFVLAFVPIKDGGFIAIDEPYFVAEEFQCLPTTTPEPTTTEEPTTSSTTEETTTRPTTPGQTRPPTRRTTHRRTRPTTVAPTTEPACEKLECNFDAGNPCSWIDLGGRRGVSKSFDTYSTRIGNRDTGVQFRPTARNPRYAGVTLGPRGRNGPNGDVAILESAAFRVQRNRFLRFKYYEATAGVELRVATNNRRNVKWRSNRHVSIADRKWQTVIIPVRNVHKLFFIAENFGKNYGSVGIDDINLLVSNSPNGRPACN
jgi:hypothetical protein